MTAPKVSYPLTWPIGRPRTNSRATSRFKVPGLGQVRDELLAELHRMGARNVILSTNLKVRLDGLPYADQRQPDDPGVAVYFTYKGKETCFCCDRWRKIEENLRAIAHTIEALRGIARWGTGDMVDAAFAGFQALPAYTPAPPWRETLGLANGCTLDDAEEAYRRLAMQHHPDRNGTHDMMTALNGAIERARKELK